MNAHIFVYGTLRKGQSNPVADLFHQQSSWVGDGRMRGHIKNLGSYPGAWYQASADHFVPGDIFKMNSPAEMLEVLDQYEGIGPTFPIPHEYVRKVCPIWTSGKVLFCWVYLYNGDFLS